MLPSLNQKELIVFIKIKQLNTKNKLWLNLSWLICLYQLRCFLSLIFIRTQYFYKNITTRY